MVAMLLNISLYIEFFLIAKFSKIKEINRGKLIS